ncbi:MAG: hypothetical protein DWQ47_08875 [Acidobacteria bacterium]|nr:MAG: hypothetical protein DWQ32_16975 [Acidobacteriota bacterium]REJ98983.1 MAG: hypothetical protein DWQ38_13005 [Acidobacteriota bacterium]REK16297.1 MAG: hypothetical protein DWQ43_04685 [Acidobacteriota bacterium]REK43978.1 MAG: hypothetical protein DWQ47_08875 [Acidobacteriota bacterium]
MPKIFVITTGLTGMLYASLEIACELEDAGFEVVYGCPQDVAETVERYGIGYRQLAPVTFDTEPVIPEFHGLLRSLRRIVHRAVHSGQRRREAFRSMKIGTVLRALESVGPDVVLADIELHEYIISARIKGIPVIGLSPWFSLWRSSRLPPLWKPTIPGENRWGSRPGIELDWFRTTASHGARNLANGLLSGFTDRASMLRSLSRTAKIPRRELIGSLKFPRPFIYRTLPVITTAVEKLEFPHDRRADLYYAGPLGTHRRAALEMVPKELEEFLIAGDGPGKKLIYCTVGSMENAGSTIVEHAIDAARLRPNWKFVVSAGDLVLNPDFGTLPKNVFVSKTIPQLKVLERADCAIIHGGIHTINECLSAGVQMLVISGGRFDQEGCAARVAYHRVGLRRDPLSADGTSIVSDLEKMFATEEYVERVRDVRDSSIAHRWPVASALGEILDSESEWVSA